MFLCLVFLVVGVASVSSSLRTNPIRDVSHEDIRDAILSLVHMFRDSTDKLDRQESRERQLGDQLKKALATIEKKQKSEDNTEKILETLNIINTRLEKLESASAKDDIHSNVSESQQQLQKSLDIEKQATNQIIETALHNILTMVSQIQLSLTVFQDKATQVVTDSYIPMAIVNKIDDKLTKLDGQRDILDNVFLLQHDFLNKTNKIQLDLEKLNLMDNSDDEQISNETLHKLKELKYLIQESNDRGKEQVEKLQNVLQTQEKVLFLMSNATNAGVNYADIQNTYDELLKEVKGLSKIDQLLIQTADNVLDTKRRIEYGTHQILMEVGELIKVSAEDTKETVNKRFDMISIEILNNQNGGVKNLSIQLETEISQVWRQIGIMYQTLTNSADALDKLQHQTEIYVNGSLNTMDNMEGKVGLITSRMSEVDDNLNYLLGRLSLVTQEFNQIKTGLGQALDNIRSSFHTVQDKVKDVGPGPNPIEDDNLKRSLKKTQYTVY